MQTALSLGESEQQTLVPKQIIGLTAVLLTGATLTPINWQVASLSSQRLSASQIPEGVITQRTGEIVENIVVEPQQQITSIQLMEQRAGADIIPTGNVQTIALIEEKEETEDVRTKIVSSALTWQGVRYCWGGETKKGVDCSGLVQQVFAEHGIQLPRTSYDQFRKGVGIPKAKLEAGDLVFFNTNGSGASHVGIYIGEGNFISATKYGVRVESLEEPYWLKTYRGSKRILN
ncbi:MAG: C40 family peptidase [Desulfitobacteriia bacterium]|jgi:cell wall-associated NlpC family hydrolase